MTSRAPHGWESGRSWCAGFGFRGSDCAEHGWDMRHDEAGADAVPVEADEQLQVSHSLVRRLRPFIV